MSALIRLELEALIAQFAWRIDHDGGRGVEDLFTEDGVYGFEFGAMQGREAIAGFYRWRRSGETRTSRHLFSNLHVHAASDEKATASCVLTLHAGDGEAPLPLDPVMVADYHDTVVRCGDGAWRFAEREVALVFGEFPHMRGHGA